MFSNYLKSIAGVEIYPIISLAIFFVFFVVLIYKLIKMDSSYIKQMEKLPFEPETELNKNSEEHIK